MTELCDALVVGAGVNGLVAAVVLADAGWDVVVVERNQEPGGAVRTAEVTEPGFKHDLFAMNLNLFAGSAFHGRFERRLREHGLAFAHSPRPFAIQTGVQHCNGLPSSLEDARSITPREALLHGIPYHPGTERRFE